MQVLDGLWKPPPMPLDLYSPTQYDNDLAWIILSSANSGSQVGAWQCQYCHQSMDYGPIWLVLFSSSLCTLHTAEVVFLLCQVHQDPDLMGAWNLLLTGRKWWAVHPAPLNIRHVDCNTK